MPLGLNSAISSSAPIAATTSNAINHVTRPWFPTKILQSTKIIKTLQDSRKPAANSRKTARLLSLVARSSLENNDSDLAQTAGHFTWRSLHRRLPDKLGNNGFVTAMFVLLIVLAVLLGIATASIAVCGIDWKRYLTRSRRREDTNIAEKEAANAS
ncbi:hypothetical protein C7999DRAFT_30045 [Corynascus novoguineensis]|uniref:Transmembrane protein n=1 Tax=Corynascus novoguineensis TaxID=1126955 RepID=A0AAN7CWY0_9PEZI|nr:hypothetical protein C7999DRAFT_30045 [Corynascus novoguineensis]